MILEALKILLKLIHFIPKLSRIFNVSVSIISVFKEKKAFYIANKQ